MPQSSENVNNLSPVEYLRYLQEQFARLPVSSSKWKSPDLNTPQSRQIELDRSKQMLETLLQGVEDEEKHRQDMEKTHQKIASVSIPTDIGNPAGQLLLGSICPKVEAISEQLGYSIDQEVVFGTLPTGQVNGCACPVPSGGTVIALDDGVFTFFNLIAKSVATFYKTEIIDDRLIISLSERDLDKALRANVDGNQRWLEALTAAFAYGWPDMAPIRLLTDNRQSFVGLLRDSAEAFIVAHEYGHMFLGHLKSDNETKKYQMAPSLEVDVLNPSQQEELDADRVALQLLYEFNKSEGFIADQTLASLWFLIGCLKLLEEHTGPSSTHPNIEIRSRHLLNTYADIADSDIRDPDAARVVFEVMRAMRLFNHERYISWRKTAENGTVPWEDQSFPET